MLLSEVRNDTPSEDSKQLKSGEIIPNTKSIKSEPERSKKTAQTLHRNYIFGDVNILNISKHMSDDIRPFIDCVKDRDTSALNEKDNIDTIINCTEIDANVVIHLGRNDILEEYNIHDTTSNLKCAIENLLQKRDARKISICGVAPTQDATVDREARKLNLVIKKLCESKKVQFIDPWDFLKESRQIILVKNDLELNNSAEKFLAEEIGKHLHTQKTITKTTSK